MLLARATDLRPGEAKRVLAAAAWCGCLMTANYGLRPLRDAMGVAGGVEQLPWLFTATFVSMLVLTPIYGLAVARLGRARLVPIVHHVFALQLLLFFASMHGYFGEGEALALFTARAFFVWTSVFNLFVISLFWSVMADTFSGADARRLFGLISVGASLGAIAGPALGAALALWLTPAMLPLLGALLLELALLALPCVGVVRSETPQPIGGSSFAGLPEILRSRTLLGICGYILLLSATSTILYFMQAQLVAALFTDHGERTAVFASIDLAINALTIATQALLTGRVIQRVGLGWSLAAVPLLVALGFVLLASAPALSVLVAVQIARHVSNYALSRPAREVLYTAVDRSQRYKAKSLIDTVIYRGGDALTGWMFAGLAGMGLSLGAIALVGVPLAGAWALLGHRLGRRCAAPS